MRNLSVEEARARMLAGVSRLAVETVPLAAARDRVLAADIPAVRDQPPFNASAMDGWAVGDLAAPRLRIVGESAAGHGFERSLAPGEAVRIFTGAPVPRGATAVVMQENAQRDGDHVQIDIAAAPDANIRLAGGDFRQGDTLLEAGMHLDPWRLSLAAAAGRGQIEVARRPIVAILSTGEEIVPAGAAPGPWSIFDSGGPALAALVRRWGGEAIRLAPAGDNEDAIASAVGQAHCDLVVTVGGASVGDHDLVKPALARLGLVLAVETVKVRPGKPTWFGTLGDGRRVLGLPGNPASALVCAELFLKSLVKASLGASAAFSLQQAFSTVPLPANNPREHWMRARLERREGRLHVTPFPDQDSSLVSVLSKAGALLRRAADAPAAEAGSLVDILVLDHRADG